MAEHKETWYVPAYIANLREGHNPRSEDIVLFTDTDVVTMRESVFVFDLFNDCDTYLDSISPGKRDKCLAIFAFHSIEEINERVFKSFGRSIPLDITRISDGDDHFSLHFDDEI